MKKRIKRIAIIIMMLLVGVATKPNSALFTKEFWLWLTAIFAVTILLAAIFLEEDQWEFFNSISCENFKKAPIFGVLMFPIMISMTALVYTGIRDFLVANLFK